METSRQYIYIVHATRPEMLTAGPTPEEQEILGQHFRYLQDLAEKGPVLLVGRIQTTDESTFGLCIFEAASEDEARALMNGDPAVARGVMTAQLFPYQIAIKGARL